jgi:tyrosyl-tRNA synthetase
MNKREVLTRNTEEVVTEEEVVEMLEEGGDNSAYVGYETSGPAHLGHWISARKLMDADEAGFQPMVLWADKHTYMNKKGDENWGREETREWISDMADYWQATFESLGLEDAEFVHGSDFQRTEEYNKDFEDFSTIVTENRARKALGDVAGDQSETYVSQINYPLFQSLDIAHLDVDLAIGGTDQRKIHMLAREKLPNLGYDAPTAMHYPLLTSLKGGSEKMSSSKPSTMFPLHAAEDTIRDRIGGAYCPTDMDQVENDAAGEENWDVLDEDELADHNPVLQISRFFIFGADEELHIEIPDEYGGDEHYDEFDVLYDDVRSGELHPQDLKNGVADYVTDRLEPVRERFKEEPGLLQPLQKAGYEMPDYVEGEV